MKFLATHKVRKLSNRQKAGDIIHSGRALGLAFLLGVVLLIGSFTDLSIQAAPPAQGPLDIQDLLAKVQSQGVVRVIVGLNTPFQPEGQLVSRQAVQNQRQGIAETQDAVLQKMAGSNTTLVARFKYIPYMALKVDPAALKSLATLPMITTINEDIVMSVALESSIPVIGADKAWAAGYTGAGQTVAILDTGVDKTHPFFTSGSNKIVSEACYSSQDLSIGIISVCPGGVTETTLSGSGIDCTAVTTDYQTAQQTCSHGTHVAGVAAGNDGLGPNIGVARDADLIAIQVFSVFTDFAASVVCAAGETNCLSSILSDHIKGLERVYELRNDFNIAAANISIGFVNWGVFSTHCDNEWPSYTAAINNLHSVDIATLIAAGNGSARNGEYFPACISTAVSVGATTDDDNIASSSNIASFTDLVAPGVSITSAVPGGTVASGGGTSAAAPHVAGAWAVMKQKAPAATVDEVLTALRASGTSIADNRTAPPGTVTDLRRINIDQALDELSPDLIVTKIGPTLVQAGDLISYTIVLANNGSVTATNVRITDTLPNFVNGLNLDTIVSVNAKQSALLNVEASVVSTTPLGTIITNTVYYTHTSGGGQSSAIFTVIRKTYLPLILKN